MLDCGQVQELAVLLRAVAHDFLPVAGQVDGQEQAIRYRQGFHRAGVLDANVVRVEQGRPGVLAPEVFVGYPGVLSMNKPDLIQGKLLGDLNRKRPGNHLEIQRADIPRGDLIKS